MLLFITCRVKIIIETKKERERDEYIYKELTANKPFYICVNDEKEQRMDEMEFCSNSNLHPPSPLTSKEL